MWQYNDTLYHYGIPGMRWGIRSKISKMKTNSRMKKVRKAKAIKKKEADKAAKANQVVKKPTVKDLSDADLKKIVDRLDMEKRYNAYQASTVSAGKKYATLFFDKAVVPAVTETGKDIIKGQLTKAITKALEKEDKK